jgi:hypothetical protein
MLLRDDLEWVNVGDGDTGIRESPRVDLIDGLYDVLNVAYANALVPPDVISDIDGLSFWIQHEEWRVELGEQLRCGTGGVKLRLQQMTLPPVATSVLFALGKGSRSMVVPQVAIQGAPVPHRSISQRKRGSGEESRSQDYSEFGAP